jgi:outer membrane protein
MVSLNKIKRSGAFFLSLIVAISPLYAQQKWTLEACIAHALSHNLEIKSRALNMNASKILVDKSKLNFVPSLDFSTNYQFSVGRSLDPTTYSFIENKEVNTLNANLNLGTVVFGGFRRYYNYKKSLSDLDVSEADYRVLKNDISLSVTMGFMNVLLNKEVIHSIQRQISISETNIKKAERLLEEGVITDEKLQSLLIQRDNESYSLADAEGNLRTSKINLCSLLNLSEYDSFDVADDSAFIIQDPIPAPDVIASISLLPQMEAAQLRLKSAEYALKIAQSDLYPTISLGATLASSFSDARQKPVLDESGNPLISESGIVYGNYPFFSQLNNNRNTYISLTFSLPLFSLFQTNKNISLAKNNRKQVQYELENTEKKITERIYGIYSEIETAEKKYRAALSAAERGQVTLAYADNRLANGTLTISDYIVTKENILISEAQAGKAKYEYFFKLYLLNFYLSSR